MARLYRGVTHKFGAAFFEDSARTQPIVPFDLSAYPAYQIMDPDNNLVQSGVASVAGGSGYWETQPWTVPQDAPLSTPERGKSEVIPNANVADGTARLWRVDWVVVDAANRELQYSETFEVLALPTTVSRDRSQVYAVPINKTLRVSIRNQAAFDSIEFGMALASDPNTDLLTVTAVRNVDLGDSPDANSINRQRDGETFVYWYDLPSTWFTSEKDYQVLWTTQDTPVSELDYQHQQIYCFDRRWLNWTKPVYMLIDKLQKTAGTFQAYTQGDVIEYLRRGLQMLNAWHPANTAWNITSFPGGNMGPYLIVAAGIYALQAQYLLEGELQFQFSGQTVTLDYDHTSILDGMISKLTEFMNNFPGGGFSTVKEAYYRSSTPVGVVATRAYRWTSRGTYVYKADSGMSANSTVEYLSGYGIL